MSETPGSHTAPSAPSPGVSPAELALADHLYRIGSIINSEHDLQQIVQVVTDEATTLTGAQFGAFFYNVTDANGEALRLYTISGVPREYFSRFPQPRNTPVFGPTFRGESVVRSGDITKDPRYGHSAPHHGMPSGHLPVRSYLAVPVRSAEGRVLGGLFFGHSSTGRFTAEHESLVVGIAAWASLALENARLYRERSELAQTLVARTGPTGTSVAIGWATAALYQPAGRTEEVGGDFYDVVAVEDGWMVVIGDVIGKGPAAAARTLLARYSIRTGATVTGSPAKSRPDVTRTSQSRPAAVMEAA